jgi:hypothetical protein
MDALVAYFFVEMKEYLAIGLRLKTMAARFKFLTDRCISVELTVYYSVNGPIFVAQWLITGLKIDNAQSCVSKSHARIGG